MINLDFHNHYTKIWLRLTGIFCLLIAVPVAILIQITSSNLRDSTIDKIEVSLTRLVEHKKDVITLFLAEKSSLLTMLVGMYPVGFLGMQENLDKLFVSINRAGSIVDLHVIDSSGKQLAYVGPYSSSIAGKTYGDAQWFQEVMINGSHVSDVYLGFRNVPHFVVAVTDPLKTYVLRATVNSEQFNKLLLSSQIGPNGDSYIVNREGTLQTPSRVGLTELSQTETTLLEHHEGTSIIRQGEMIVATRWVKDGQWCLLVKTKVEDSLGPFYKNRDNVILVIVFLSAIFLIMAALLSDYLLRRLEQEDRKKAELGHQMVQIEKMATVGRMAAGIAHEINNPLQMITSQAGWIGELLPEEDPAQLKNYEEYKKSIEQIKYHVRRAGTITHRLLGYSRKISTEKQAVQVNDLIEESISFVERDAGYNNISIIREYAENMPTTTTDGALLQQVFLNLMNNAIDGVGKDGRVEIYTSVNKENMLVLEFADNGKGIKPENLKRIFDPFFTTKDPGKGTGLGLYISFDIIQKLGGKITAANRRSGGAVFTITLPIVSG